MTRKRRGREEGSIYQRSDGLWTASVSLGYDEKGKRRRRVIYGHSKTEVQEKLRQLQHDAANGRLADLCTISVKEWLTTWLETAKSRIQPKTHLRYEQIVRLRINPHLGAAKLAKLAPVHVQQLFSALERAGVSARGRQMAGTLLHKALRDAVRLRLIPSNPASEVEKPRPGKTRMQVYDEAQAKALLAAATSHRLYALFVLALDTGMRQGELFALCWEDIDFDAGSVLIQRSLEEINGKHRMKEPKSGKGRRIDLSAFALEALREHRKATLAEGHYAPDAPVFPAAEGGWLRKPNFQRRVYRPLQKSAGLPALRFHDLRHTAATLMLLNDVNVKVGQRTARPRQHPAHPRYLFSCAAHNAADSSRKDGRFFPPRGGQLEQRLTFRLATEWLQIGQPRPYGPETNNATSYYPCGIFVD